MHRSDGGVVTITGGKLTTYREMAADTVDEVLEHVLDAGVVERVQRHSRTKRLRLRGADGYDDGHRPRPTALSPLGGEVVRHLADRYGGEARTVLAIAEADPTLAEPLVPGLPYLRAEAVFAARYEMARTRRRRAEPPHPGPPARPRRLGPRRRRRRRADRPAARLGRRRAGAPGRRLPSRWSPPSGSAPHLPEVALDAALGA